jgi:FAD/FMN-containing dehydrogenase
MYRTILLCVEEARVHITIRRDDARFETLRTGHNLRFPQSEADCADRVLLCASAEEAAEALRQVVAAGLRPTVRSGGHCYEGFVSSNPHGAIIDLSLHNSVGRNAQSNAYYVAPGAMLGDVYLSLYKRYNLTLPAGSCFMVGAGGHISGGGYGLLSRLHGLTSDWLSAVDILTVDDDGTVTPRRVDATHDPELFRACRGAGGGNFGIITGFYFDRLPPAPREVASASLYFAWKDMTKERFVRLLTTYGDYWEGRGRDPDTWGLFTLLEVTPQSTGHLAIHAQFCDPDGTVADLSVLNAFLDMFAPFHPTPVPFHAPARVAAGPSTMRSRSTVQRPENPLRDVRITPWLDATIGGGASGSPTRAKYKSSYMKRTFTRAEAETFYRFYTSPDGAGEGSVVSIDSYGGAVNRPELASSTAIAQRSSVMKLQWQCYWHEESDDARHLRAMDRFYTDLYSGEHVDADHQGTPWGDRYEGCYMNYPDSDMLRYSYWPELFYGREGLYPFLQHVKQRYDPHNIFHSSMSVRGFEG